MNIFILDEDLKKSVIYHPDKHIVKMPIEATQLLCNTLYLTGQWEDWMYIPTHLGHPCNLWVSSSLDNWFWLRDYVIELGKEYTFRYHKIHKSVELCKSLPIPQIKSIGLIPFVKCVPDRFKELSVIEGYREYFKSEKEHLKKYTNRDVPNWWR